MAVTIDYYEAAAKSLALLNYKHIHVQQVVSSIPD